MDMRFIFRGLLITVLLLILPIQSVLSISDVQHSTDGNKVTITYQGTPPFFINLRGDTNIGQDGGYLWAKTYSNSFSYDISFAINPSKKFYYGIKDTSWSSTDSFTIGTIQKSCELKGECKTLAVVTDDKTYDGVTAEIKQFIEDLKKDTEYNVILKIVPTSATLKTVKDILKDLYFNSNLELAILVGEIPTAEYFPGTVSQDKIPTDSYYYDVYEKCPFNQQNQAFESKNKFCNPIVLPFIISRIKSPVKGVEGMKLIKGYLNNNHAFRTGEISYDQKALLYPQMLNDVSADSRQSTLESSLNNFERFYAIDSMPIYGKDELVIADWEDTSTNHEPNKMYLDELSKFHEYVFFNGHGYPEGHLFNVNKDTINNPSAFYVDFYSCNVGKFSQDYYAAGQYLFYGKTMFVKAASDFWFAPIGVVESNKLFLLKQGLPILEAIKAEDTSFIIQHFGDPTLKMKQGELQKNSKSKIALDANEIDFGEVKSLTTKKIVFSISNMGEDNLGFYVSVVPDYSLEIIENSHPAEGYDKPYQITFDSVLYNIAPNKKNSFNINIKGLVKGEYSGKILIYNSDPQSPLIKVPFKVKIKY